MFYYSSVDSLIVVIVTKKLNLPTVGDYAR